MSELQIPYLPEHSAPDNFNNNGQPGYQPPPEERKRLQTVDALYSQAKKYRKRYDQRWIDFYKMFRGRQWKEVRPSYRHSEVLNLVFETIQSMVPMLVDSKPKLEFLPTLPTQFELADILTKVAENDWEHNNWLMVLVEMLYDSHFYGTAFGYLGFNPNAEMGLGCIEFESQDPFYTFPDPQARDINGKRTRHFITAEPTDVSQLKKQYPDKAQWINADIVDFQQGDKADIYQVMFKSPTDSKLIVEGPSGYDSIAKNQCLKITCYTKDDEFEDQEKMQFKDDGSPVLDDTGQPTKSYERKLKYPTGRKTVIGGGVLLEDGPMEFDDGLFPFVRLTNYVLPREFWGVGEVENLDSPQKTINKIISFTLDLMTLMGNPIWVVDDSSGIDTDNLFNKPGLIVEKTAGSEVRREMGVELPSYVLPFLNLYRQFFNGVSGQTDLSKGVEPANVTAASAIEDLQQAGQTRIRLKTKGIDALLQDFGKLYLSRVFQYYSVPRIVRVSGNLNAENYFYFHVEKLEEDGVTKRFAHLTYPDGTAKKMEIEADFDVRVATGSSLPFAKQAKGDMSMNLFKLGVIDDEELLKNLDYPNYEMILQRVQQKKAAAQQAQMQMMQEMQGAKVAEMTSKAAKTQTETAILEHSALHPQPAPVPAGP